MTAKLCPGTQPNPMLIVPPGAESGRAAVDGLDELAAGAPVLASVPVWDGRGPSPGS